MEFFFDCRNLFLHGINLTPPQAGQPSAVSQGGNKQLIHQLRLGMESQQLIGLSVAHAERVC